MNHTNVKDLLDAYQCSCGSFCVSLLADRLLKDYNKTDFVHIFPTMGIFTSVRDGWYRTSWAEIRADILYYLSKFRRSERNNIFFIGKKPFRKHFERNNSSFIMTCVNTLH